jgi:hypothetical protein
MTGTLAVPMAGVAAAGVAMPRSCSMAAVQSVLFLMKTGVPCRTEGGTDVHGAGDGCWLWSNVPHSLHAEINLSASGVKVLFF